MSPKSKLQTIEAVRLLTFRAFAEPNGTLLPLTGQREIPFSIARVFYVFDVRKNEVRGEHAHVECQQLLVCLTGACEINADDGVNQTTHVLDKPTCGVLLPPSIWGTQRYLKDKSLLAVFTDRPYDEKDYIRDYQQFLAFRGLQVRRAANG